MQAILLCDREQARSYIDAPRPAMNSFFKHCLLAAGFLTGALAAVTAEPAPLRVMILSGANNHDWQKTTPVLRSILEQSGRFHVDVVDDISKLSAESFAPYDAILSNYNTFGKDTPLDAIWNAKTREAFLDHIRAGHGFVVVHAGSSGFYDWPEFQKLAITSWTLGTTRHVAPHAAPVTFGEVDHPITHGLKPYWAFDEFWESVVVQPEAKALAWVTPSAELKGSGKPEPVMFVRDYGRGRTFCFLLGHDENNMKNPVFHLLLQRGTEWAATGKVTIATAVAPWPDDEAAALKASDKTAQPVRTVH